ncbi:hypothetical protein H0H87_011073 [Tephrocybe sp. NHM501043]|nr:hypothetical protein H0H87_011073 [Tephrocybe sp. NHM501043]
MSLSRILNDDPVPAVSSSREYSVSSTTIPPATSSFQARSSSSNGHFSPSIMPHERTSDLQSPSQPDSLAGNEFLIRATLPPFSISFLGTPHYHPEYEVRRPASPNDASDAMSYGYAGDDALPRKRRRSGNPEAERHAPMTRRSTLRKQPSRTKHLQQPSRSMSPERKRRAEEELRLASSDIDDCSEIWREELEDYALKTNQRQNQVADWFQASLPIAIFKFQTNSCPLQDRNSGTAREMSHWYSSRIARIPLSAPTYDSPLLDDDLHPSPYHPSNMDFDEDPSGYRGRHRSREFSVGAADAAHELERAILGDYNEHDLPLPSKSGKGREGGKMGPVDRGDVPRLADRPVHKKRKLDNGAGLPSPLSVPTDNKSTAAKGKGKAKATPRGATPDSVSATPKHPRKKPTKKQLGLGPELELKLASHPSSTFGDVTPALSISRPPSPTTVTSLGIIFELEEHIPPLKKAKKVDDHAMVKRLKALEESQRKVWTNIARRDIAKVYKYQVSGYQARQSQVERIAKVASLQARRPFTKTAKATKDVQAKAKRLMREMQVFWKKNEKEERDVRKREQKEASDRLKVEEEKREAARQARKLEFLISQTELYSHFVGNKLKTNDIEGEAEGTTSVPAAVNIETVDPKTLADIDFDDGKCNFRLVLDNSADLIYGSEDQTNLHRHAMHNAQEAIVLAKQRAEMFDAQAALERKTNEALKLAKAQAHIHDGRENLEEPNASNEKPLVDLDSDELNFQNPTSLSGSLTIGQPKMLMAQLKEYQLKGLNWLATLYEQGINGILADEMGLGKTVQSISLLSYLAETHDIWGPFLVVAPASTLHNWQQEITRFVPGLKALPYWGNVKDRATLRKFWSKKDITYNKDAPFHVLITSYQLVTQDQQYFQRVKWQYMILDEAQNIKNSSSVRWKTLLGFQCRNRLLLTGTPIQNSMQELWALLHFIMPSLFDSHDEFNEWFSKDIENAAENKGSKLNEHQLRRLHMILKPFMLRRVKRHVQNELSEKIEKDIYVDLSARQRALYNALLAHVSVADLLEKAANIGDADSARSLMNLVMQFRKVCNHPELFERADVVAPFSFVKFGRSGPLMREGDFILLPYSTRNPIEYPIPELLYLDRGLATRPCVPSLTGSLLKMFDIWSSEWIYKSFLNDAGVSPSEVHALHMAPLIRRKLAALKQEANTISDLPSHQGPEALMCAPIAQTCFTSEHVLGCIHAIEDLPRLNQISSTTWSASCLSRPELRWFVPPVVAPPITLSCTDRTFMDRQSDFLDAPLETLAFYGLPLSLYDSQEACHVYSENFPRVPCDGLLRTSPANQLPMSTMQVPEAKRLIYDSAKLARLDALLQELKQGDHRVLVYFQMTRMMDLMEEYLIYRQYKYLRLDGSSKIEDRRDMVIDWQTRPDIFVFLLSTRAGGLGINLTAADTVIFYDHDWNPSNDAQAMDRAHRLGQTRQVTVYRLITKGTIDERIVQLARVKKDVQDIVVGNKNFTDVTKPSEIVQLLLNDEQLATLSSSASQAPGSQSDVAPAEGEKKPPVQDLWNDEEDNFFGHSASLAPAPDGDDQGIPIATSTRGKKRKAGATGAPRGRRPGGRKKMEMTVVKEAV